MALVRYTCSAQYVPAGWRHECCPQQAMTHTGLGTIHGRDQRVLAVGQGRRRRRLTAVVGQQFQLEKGRPIDFHFVVVVPAGVYLHIQSVLGKGHGSEGDLRVVENCVGARQENVFIDQRRIVGVLPRELPQEICALGLVKAGPGDKLDDGFLVIGWIRRRFVSSRRYCRRASTLWLLLLSLMLLLLALEVKVSEDLSGEGRVVAPLVHQDLVGAQDGHTGDGFRVALPVALLRDGEQKGRRQVQRDDAGFPCQVFPDGAQHVGFWWRWLLCRGKAASCCVLFANAIAIAAAGDSEAVACVVGSPR